MTTLVSRWGVLGILVLMIPESACIPVPSEVTLMAAGFAVRQGWMSFPLAVLAATAGNLAGSLIAYGAGRFAAGRAVPAWAAGALGRCGGLFARHGSRAVFVARLLPLARTFVSLPAGHARVRLAPFVVMTTIGCAIWAIAFALLGFLAASGWASLSGTIGKLSLAIGAVILVAALIRIAAPANHDG